MFTNLFSNITRLSANFSSDRKTQLAGLGIALFFAAFAEMMSISLVVPFIAVLIQPEKALDLISFPMFVEEWLKALNKDELTQLLTTVFVGVSIATGFMRLLLLRIQTRLFMGLAADLSVKVYERTLNQSYESFLNCSTSDILAGSQKARDVVTLVINPLVTILVSSTILLCLIVVLLNIEPMLTLFTILLLATLYSVIISYNKSRLNSCSDLISSQQGIIIKLVQEGLGSFRSIAASGIQSLYVNMYRDAITPLQAAHAKSMVLSTAPRYAIEALVISTFAFIAYLYVNSGNQSFTATALLSSLAAMALGAQRVLPLLNQIYNSFITIKSYETSTRDVIRLLEQPIESRQALTVSIPVFKTIILNNAGYRYRGSDDWVLRSANLTVHRGDKIGVIGLSGAGKSTLMDIIMGLLVPLEGQLLVDGVQITSKELHAWRKKFAHVPQSIFLKDGTIAENIAFGIPKDEVDTSKLMAAAEKAGMIDTIEGFRDGFSTIVGEWGLKLSGGQRQRIGIARALYLKETEILVLDEATNALDTSAEREVLEAVSNLGEEITVLIVAHRLSALRCCTRIVQIESGAVVDKGIKVALRV